MIRDDCSTELGNVVFKVDQVLALFVGDDIVEVDIFVAPFEVVDDALVSQLLLHDENVLEEVNDSLIDVKMVELSYHSLLILQITLVLVD